MSGNQFPLDDLTLCHPLLNETVTLELVMNRRISNNIEPIDGKTCRSICDAVGERLQQSLRPERLPPSSYLEHLMDELRRRDADGGRKTSN